MRTRARAHVALRTTVTCQHPLTVLLRFVLGHVQYMDGSLRKAWFGRDKNIHGTIRKSRCASPIPRSLSATLATDTTFGSSVMLRVHADYPVEEAASYGQYPSTTASSFNTDPIWCTTDSSTFDTQLERVNTVLRERFHALPGLPTTSSKSAIENALSSLPKELPRVGLGLKGMSTMDHATYRLGDSLKAAVDRDDEPPPRDDLARAHARSKRSALLRTRTRRSHPGCSACRRDRDEL